MKQTLKALRLLFGMMLVSTALSLVGLAQQAAGEEKKPEVKEYPRTRIEAMAHEWTRARDFTREYLDAMPEDGINHKPTPEIRSFAEQMLHLANANFNFGARLTQRPNPYDKKNLEKMDEFRKKDALTRVVMESYDFMIEGISRMNDAGLDFRTPVAGMNRPLSALFAAAFEHQTHHRGQTTIYLRMKGVKPPPEKLF